MAKEALPVNQVVSSRTQAFGSRAEYRRGRQNAIINTALRARSLRERYGANEGDRNYERINRAARRMVNKLI